MDSFQLERLTKAAESFTASIDKLVEALSAEPALRIDYKKLLSVVNAELNEHWGKFAGGGFPIPDDIIVDDFRNEHRRVNGLAPRVIIRPREVNPTPADPACQIRAVEIFPNGERVSWSPEPGDDDSFSEEALRKFFGQGAEVMLLTPALLIEGWMTPEELVWLAETASRSSAIVEVGSYLGRSSRALADNTPGVLLCVDDWSGPRDADVKDRETLLSRFQSNMFTSPATQAGRVSCWKVDHAAITPSLIQSQLGSTGSDFFADFIFIDGDHAYESVHRDIRTWLPFLAPGGIISGHDYSLAYPGVVRAVHELVPGAAQANPHVSIWSWVKEKKEEIPCP